MEFPESCQILFALDFAIRGLRSLAVAYEELDGNGHEAEGNGFELIGLLAKGYVSYISSI